MAYTIFYSSRFKEEYKRYQRKHRELNAIKECIMILSQNGYAGIPLHMKPHKLSGNYKGYWECHVLPDLVILWEQTERPEKNIYLFRVGSHSEIF